LLNIQVLERKRRRLRKMNKTKENKIEKEVVAKDESLKVDEKKDDSKVIKKEVAKKKIVAKEMVFAKGNGMSVSPKQCIYICKAILKKNPDAAIAKLQSVVDGKGFIPMAGLEVGHRKGKGMAGGRFPINSCKAVIGVVKQLVANAVVAGIENPVIVIAKSDRASAPFRRDGRKAKRCNLYLEARDGTKLVGKK